MKCIAATTSVQKTRANYRDAFAWKVKVNRIFLTLLSFVQDDLITCKFCEFVLKCSSQLH